MRPELFRIPVPPIAMSLSSLWGWLAGVGLLLILLGRKAKSRELSLSGLGLGVIGSVAALSLRGASLEIASYPFSSYGVFLAVGLGLSLTYARRAASRDGLPSAPVEGAVVAAVVFGILGARVSYVLTNAHDFHSLADVLALRRGGFSLPGAVLCGSLASFWWLRQSAVSWLVWAESTLSGWLAALVSGGVGAWLSGAVYGRPLSDEAPRWLARVGTFPRWDGAAWGTGAPAWVDHVIRRTLSLEATESLPVHPTQLYGVAVAVALLGVAPRLRRFQSFRGETLLLVSFIYATLSFAIEALRDDLERGAIGPAVPARLSLSLVGLFAAACLALGPLRNLRKWERQKLGWLGALGITVAACLLLTGRASGGVASPLTAVQGSCIVALGFCTWAFIRKSRAKRRGGKHPPEARTDSAAGVRP